MLQVPAVIILAIAATRMYRSLVDFASETTDMSDILSFHIYPCSQCSIPCSIQDDPQADSHIFSRTKDTPRARTPVARMEVNMHAVYEQYPESQTSSPSVMDGQLWHNSIAASGDEVLEGEMAGRLP